jgi:phage-related protein
MKRVPAIFFRTAAGHEPVREWLKAMDVEDRRRIGEDMKTVEYGWPVGMPICRAMRDGLHEVRSRLSGNRIARVLFYIDKRQRMVVLHGFIKKSRETPATDLAFARANKRAHERTLI